VRVITLADCRFPDPPVLRLCEYVADWRTRLRAAIERSGKKHSAVARDAGIAPETLSRILNAVHAQPSFDTVVRIARAVNENVGWLLDERGFSLSVEEQRELRRVVRFLDDSLLGANAHRRETHVANAIPAGAPGVEIPRVYGTRGARLVYEVAGDAMIGAGIADRDLVFVKPTRNTRDANSRVVVCRYDGAEYVRVLDVRAGRVRLLSRNERYPAIEITETTKGFELVGVVVGRTGAV
jgi:SOS-response transcriptional repressor LexA